MMLKEVLKNAVASCWHERQLDTSNTDGHISATPAMSSPTGWFPFQGKA